ncbi:MAG: PAS domain-containing protein [Candidatus Firestonebacteria bacterium]|nr:PAS domain-containing protein [Candidatus Firestonebacteria bacterium]
MKPTKKMTSPQEKRIPHKSKIPSASPRPSKTSRAQHHQNASNQKQERLLGLVLNLNKSRKHLGEKIRRQTDELHLKDGLLRRGADLLQQSDEQIRLLTQAIESAADGVFIINVQKSNFPIIYSNPAFRTMTGYTKQAVMGLSYFTLYGTDPDLRLITEIKQTIRQKGYFTEELPNFKQNGTRYWCQLRLTPVRDASGTVAHYTGIQTDVTFMRQQDLEIHEQRDELLHVTRVGKLAEFVSSLAHEISQPLTAILSYTQAAQRVLADREPQIREILQYISNDDVRAIEVIRRLRSLLKKSVPEIKPLDLNTLIQDTLALVATDAMIRNVRLNSELSPGLPPINGDRIQLQQVLLNLISNSFDAMENSPTDRLLSIRTTRKDNTAFIVTITDTGCGIPATNLPKLFTHFFTSKADGLGMGLSISRSIVEAHGGRLTGENNPERGATFIFTLPMKRKGPQ